MATGINGTRPRSSSIPTPPKPPFNPTNLSNDENTPPINHPSRTPPLSNTPRDLTVKIGDTEYVMTIYVDNKKVAITDADTMEKIKKIAQQLIDEIETEKGKIFDGKIVKDITDNGIFDTDDKLIHAFDENGNTIWNELKTIILSIQPQSLPGAVRVELNKQQSISTDPSSSKRSANPPTSQTDEERKAELRKNRRINPFLRQRAQ